MTQKTENLQAIYDVPLKISAVLGSTKMTVQELLGCTQGTIVELDKQLGEAVDLYVNDKVIARGEVVLVGDKIGITLTEIVS